MSTISQPRTVICLQYDKLRLIVHADRLRWSHYHCAVWLSGLWVLVHTLVDTRLLVVALGLKTRNVHLISVSYPGSLGGSLCLAASKATRLGTAGSILNTLQAFAASHIDLAML